MDPPSPVTVSLLPMPADVAEVLRPKAAPAVADWTEANYTLPKKSEAMPGRWQRSYVPFLIEPMEWFGDEYTEEIVLQACMQGGKTIFVNAGIGYVADVDPGPAMLVLPTKEAVERRLAGRLRPMFEDNPSLLRHLGGKIENFNIGKETVLDNMVLYIGWAGSPIVLGDVSLRYGWIDEAALHTADTGDVDYITLFKRRFRAFRGRWKLVLTSSPKNKGGRFDSEFERGSRCRWWARCPHCQKYHEMAFEHVRIDKDPEGRWLHPEIYKDGKHARYHCPECGAAWTEYERWRAVSAGKWCPAGGRVDDEGMVCTEGYRGQRCPAAKHRSVRIPAWLLHPLVTTIGDIVAGFAAARMALKAGDAHLWRDWLNNEAGQAWREDDVVTDVDVLRRHVGQYASRRVPWGVQRISAGIDVQKDHVVLLVLGWGYMAEVWTLFETIIETGDTSRIANWDTVEQRLVNMRFELAWDDDRIMRIGQIAVDAQYNTDVVLDFCRASQLDIVPVAGSDAVRHATYRRSPVLGGTMMRYDLNLMVIKNRLYRVFFLSDPDQPGPGYGHLHRDTPEDVLDQLASEERITVTEGHRGRLRWVPKTAGRANHYWDCAVYATFAAEMAGYLDLPNTDDFAALMRAETQKKTAQTNIETKPIRTRY